MAQKGVAILDGTIVEKNGLELIGIGYKGNSLGAYKKELDAVFAKTKSTDYRVFASHIPSTVAYADGAGMNLQMYGHTHCGQLFPFNELPSLMFGGYSNGYYALKNGGAYVSCGVGAWLTPMKTAARSEIVVYQF